MKSLHRTYQSRDFIEELDRNVLQDSEKYCKLEENSKIDKLSKCDFIIRRKGK